MKQVAGRHYINWDFLGQEKVKLWVSVLMPYSDLAPAVFCKDFSTAMLSFQCTALSLQESSLISAISVGAPPTCGLSGWWADFLVGEFVGRQTRSFGCATRSSRSVGRFSWAREMELAQRDMGWQSLGNAPEQTQLFKCEKHLWIPHQAGHFLGEKTLLDWSRVRKL